MRRKRVKEYVSLTLNEILKQIKRNKRLSKINYKKCYKIYNKKYKNLDWKKKYFSSSEVMQSLGDDYFKCFRRLKSDKEIIPIKIDRNYFYKRENVELLCLLKEVASTLEDKFFDVREKRPWKPEYIPYYFDSLYRGRTYICAIPKSKEEKSKLVTEFLKKKEFLFDEDSPFFKGSYKTIRFIEKNLINGKVEKWNYYLQRFVSENDK